MRRRRVIVGLVVLAVAGVVAVVLWPRGPRPCRETFELVREGMTREEVIASVGGPPGDYSDGQSWAGGYGAFHAGDESWRALDDELEVWYGPDGHVSGVEIVPTLRLPRPTVWSRFRARLGL